jgi:DNA primase
MFRARVMFPIRDAQARVLAFGGRVLDARLPKYINSPESPLYSKTRTLYGLNEARQAITAKQSSGKDRAILVEGYFDVIALWQAGFKEAVAGCGTALTVEQLRLLSRYTKNVIACFDGDEAGRKASMRALEIFLQAGLLGHGIFIPSGFDPDTFVRERGAAAFAELADNAELLVDYFLREQKSEARGSIAERANAAARVSAMLKLVGDPFQFDLLARKAADLLGIGEQVLRKEARGTDTRTTRFSRGPRAESRPATATTSGDAGAKAEIGLVALALLRPELRAEIAASGATANFKDLRLGEVLADVCGTDEEYSALEQWISERLSAEEQSRIAEVAVTPLADPLEKDTQRDANGDPNDMKKARKLARHYAATIKEWRHASEIAVVKKDTWETPTAEKAQEYILLRRAQTKLADDRRT